MNDDLKLLADAVKVILDKHNINYKQNYRFNEFKHPFTVPFYLPDKHLVITVDDITSLHAWEFKLAVKQQTQARKCESKNIKYITYDGKNDDLIKQIVLE